MHILTRQCHTGVPIFSFAQFTVKRFLGTIYVGDSFKDLLHFHQTPYFCMSFRTSSCCVPFAIDGSCEPRVITCLRPIFSGCSLYHFTIAFPAHPGSLPTPRE